MPRKDLKDHEADYLSVAKFIEQPQFKEPCPCNSAQNYGACCGRDMPCDCHSHKAAGDCCYPQKQAEPITG